jgi:tRNA pseudouridine55 synthase
MELRINKIQRDEFGRPHGVLAIDKPAGITSHDLVDKVRRILRIKQVGHAGALDPFATGLMILLVGKATKLSDKFLNNDKEYLAKVLFGISTDSADTEGKITQVADAHDFVSEQLLDPVLAKFQGPHTQYVPVYSSVKVAGNKLRVLARSASSFSITEIDGKKHVIFAFPSGDKDIELPSHEVQLHELELMNFDDSVNIAQSTFGENNREQLKDQLNFPIAEIRVACSKGTYIRTLAEDIGAALPRAVPSMLVELRRTRIGKIDIAHSVTVAQLEETLLGAPPAPELL